MFTERWIHFTGHFGSKTEKKKIAENKKQFKLPNSKP
jgi:hypothetical protein